MRDSQAELRGQRMTRAVSFIQSGLGSLSSKGVLRVKDLREKPSNEEEVQG